ncbi:hypothetical protein KEM56_007212 [Ascosphaera pollenicola]|nr:hypothetical protein KEM56_007212 [Ascosphaera pollenicola]
MPPSATTQMMMARPEAHVGHRRQLGQAAGFPLSPMIEREDDRQHLHHHRLPPQMNAYYRDGRSSADSLSPPGMSGALSVVGQPGMPSPAPRPRGPKLKFTPTEDSLLIELKENKNLTWKQIADFFPGRTSGTLQVRYCTKLKAKATVWTDDAVHRLRTALEEYENDRWRLIAIKVGNGFSPTACREKAAELDGVVPDEQHDESASQ